MLTRGQRKTSEGTLVTLWSLQICHPWPKVVGMEAGGALWDGPQSQLPSHWISPSLGQTCEAKAVQGGGESGRAPDLPLLWGPGQVPRQRGLGCWAVSCALLERELPSTPAQARQAGRSKNTTESKKQTRE